MSEALTPLRRTLLILACLAGLGFSAVLAVYHFHGQVALFSSLCRQESLGLDCVAVSQSPHSRIFGVPQALVGMGFFLLQLGYTLGTTARRGALCHAVPNTFCQHISNTYCLKISARAGTSYVTSRFYAENGVLDAELKHFCVCKKCPSRNS